ncbi:hypothetical protein [Candidatus Hodgkinia cicadicola]
MFGLNVWIKSMDRWKIGSLMGCSILVWYLIMRWDSNFVVLLLVKM